MKFLVMLITLCSVSTFANQDHTVKLSAELIEALVSKDGTYARFDDLNEGFVKFDGVTAEQAQLFIDLTNSQLNTVLLKDGRRISAESMKAVLDGGDMGGGGTAN